MAPGRIFQEFSGTRKMVEKCPDHARKMVLDHFRSIFRPFSGYRKILQKSGPGPFFDHFSSIFRAPGKSAENAFLEHFRGFPPFVESKQDWNIIGPVCKTIFHTRLRLLAHLSDKRRTACQSAILDAPDVYRPLSDERISELDALDRVTRSDARQRGHTHPVACRTAVTAEGKRIGRVTQ